MNLKEMREQVEREPYFVLRYAEALVLLDAFEEALGLLRATNVTCPTPRQFAKWEDEVKAFLAKHKEMG